MTAFPEQDILSFENRYEMATLKQKEDKLEKLEIVWGRDEWLAKPQDVQHPKQVK